MLGLGLEIASVPSASTFVIGVIPRAKKIEKRMNKDFFKFFIIFYLRFFVIILSHITQNESGNNYERKIFPDIKSHFKK